MTEKRPRALAQLFQSQSFDLVVINIKEKSVKNLGGVNLWKKLKKEKF
ncbi:hypothetical protein [Lactococcus cremoris]|nr:hypothetical protein [Lactococcus cremoris]BCO02754.1 hypothetical protein LLG32_08480 [Lactococcus cremoris]